MFLSGHPTKQKGDGMLDVLRKRRSIRRFENRAIAAGVLTNLKESVLRAPSSRGLASRQFVFVTDHSVLQELSRAKSAGAAFLADAPLGVVVCGDPEVSDVWTEDCAIAAIILQLTATSLGLGSCWIQIRNRTDGMGRASGDRIRKILGLARGLNVECVVAVGYPAEEKPPLPAEKLDSTSITEI